MSQYERYEKRLLHALSGGAGSACPPVIRHRLLDRTRKMARDYQNGNPEASWEEVEQFLGDPRELAQAMLEVEDQKVLEQYTHKKHLLKRIAMGIVAALFVLLLGLLIYMKQPLYITMEETLVITGPVDSTLQEETP